MRKEKKKLYTYNLLFVELRPYKYAGYPQLIKTIRLETQDDQLFSKEVPLLTAASELCYHTVYCSALNAEELRRENGIEALLDAYTRCVSIMGIDSKPTEVHYQIISNITKCFEVACNFEQCKKKIIELPQLLTDVCRVVYFKHSLSVGLVTSLAANNYDLQTNLVKNGILWSVVMFLFNYDYTLDESGVKTDEKSNQQKSANNLATLSILAIVALCGYDLELMLDPNDPLNNAIKSTQKPRSSITNATSVAGSGNKTSAYTSNATNVIQNNAIHAVQINNNHNSNKTANFTSYVGKTLNDTVSSSEEVFEPETVVEKKNLANNRKYVVSGDATNVVVKKIIDQLLTKYIADKLATHSDAEVLKLLTSNTRNPYMIWDNATRVQLLDFLEYQRTKNIKEQYADVTDIHNIVSEFSFDAHRDELQIGGIYIRIYNEQSTFPIANPVTFVIDLLDFLKQGYAYLLQNKSSNCDNRNVGNQIMKPTLAPNHPQRPKRASRDGVDSMLTEYNRSKARNQLETSASKTNSSNSIGEKLEFAAYTGDPIENVLCALKALISVIISNPNVELQCIGHFEMLFGFVSTNLSARDEETKALGLEIVSLVSRNKECVNEIAACEILGQFLIALKDEELKPMQMRVLETLSGLLNVQRMVKGAQSKGVVIYLLDLFCNSRNPQIRECCADLLGKMTADKLSGPKIRISVCKFLPGVFLDAMIESPPIAVQMFETAHEHPELIWNDKTRDKVIDAVTRFSNDFWQKQSTNPKHLWKDPDTLQDITSNELIVSGVYLKLFVTNPGWTLRKPKQFLSDLLDFVAANITKTSTTKEKESLELSTTALIALLNAQPNLADAIPVLGHIPKFFTQLSIQPKSALKVLHQLSLSEVGNRNSETVNCSSNAFNEFAFFFSDLRTSDISNGMHCIAEKMLGN